jgi:GNAT superfamily N-acetyltransferase
VEHKPDGLKGTVVRSRLQRALAHPFGFRRLLVRELRLNEDLPSIEPRVPATLCRLGPEDWSDLIALRPFLTEEVIRLRLSNGHRFYGARVDGRTVHVQAMAVGKAFNSFLDIVFPLSPVEIYFYEAYTLPEYRGQHISPAVTVWAAAEMRKAGYERALVFIYPHNRPALQANARQGFRQVGHFGYVDLLGVRRYFYWSRGGGFERVPNRLLVRKQSLVPMDIQGTIW